MSLPTALYQRLTDKGVIIPDADAVHIGNDVDVERIGAEGVTLYPGCRIAGASTWIGQGAQLGGEGPVTIDNCHIGPDAALKGGFFKNAVFLEKASMGSGAHVREGTILEEQASGAHCVGLKQTILFPYVTLGSLINFCDCLMAGGTGRRNHSEVGSSYIHFNFTPNQDKATPSLIGDVPQGVMLDQPPIFLGGQGGLVGPCRLAFGTVIAAGSIYRKDVSETGRMVFEGSPRGGSVPFVQGIYRSVKRVVVHNIFYIANLMALAQWYRHVRSLFIGDRFNTFLWKGLLANIDSAIEERIKRLGELASKMPVSIALQPDRATEMLIQKQALHQRWEDVAAFLTGMKGYGGDSGQRDGFLEQLSEVGSLADKGYLAVIAGLKDETRRNGTHWLRGLVAAVEEGVARIWPEFYGHIQGERSGEV